MQMWILKILWVSIEQTTYSLPGMKVHIQEPSFVILPYNL